MRAIKSRLLMVAAVVAVLLVILTFIWLTRERVYLSVDVGSGAVTRIVYKRNSSLISFDAYVESLDDNDRVLFRKKILKNRDSGRDIAERIVQFCVADSKLVLDIAEMARISEPQPSGVNVCAKNL